MIISILKKKFFTFHENKASFIRKQNLQGINKDLFNFFFNFLTNLKELFMSRYLRWINDS